MSRSKYRYQDDDEEDIGEHERFKNKTRDVSLVKQEISKEVCIDYFSIGESST